jgi:molybdopterin-guanine dinucleotide biosynthesis protein B
MTPYVRIIGPKNSGKTSLIEALVRELVARGHRVGTIKHDAHEFEMDYPGKDTWRHRQAGSVATAIFSQTQLALVRSIAEPLSLTTLLQSYFGDCDLVLVEGCRREGGLAIRLGGERDDERVVDGELLAELLRGYDLDAAQVKEIADRVEAATGEGRVDP